MAYNLAAKTRPKPAWIECSITPIKLPIFNILNHVASDVFSGRTVLEYVLLAT